MKVRVLSLAITCCAVAAIVALVVSPKPVDAKPTRPTVATPVISCGEATQASIYIEVCAGSTGASSGFTVQWMPADVFVNEFNSVWPSSDLLCYGSFSGNANLSRYNLGPGECVTVNIGELLLDEGASVHPEDTDDVDYPCDDALACGTEYVFRAFAHSADGLQRSDFTGNLYCSTLDCGSAESCTFTQGYWKTHGPEGCATGMNQDEWPVTNLTLGTVAYTDLELCSILNKAAAGNGLISLAHQLIAAKLNVANGADDSDVADAIDAADALIGGLVVPPVGSGSLAPGATSALVAELTAYNEGATGPGHCDE